MAAALAAVQETEEGKSMMQKNFLLLVLFVVVVSIPGCYTVLWSPGEEISDKEYANYNIDEPVIYEPGCWGCYYNPSPWWFPTASVEEKDNQRKYLDKNLRTNGDRNDLPVVNRPVNPISLPGPSGPIITTGSPGRPYTPPSNPKPPATTGGGGTVTQPATPTKAPDKIDGVEKKTEPVKPERQRDTGSTGQSQPTPTSSDRDRSNSNSNNDNNSPTRSNGGGRR